MIGIGVTDQLILMSNPDSLLGLKHIRDREGVETASMCQTTSLCKSATILMGIPKLEVGEGKVLISPCELTNPHPIHISISEFSPVIFYPYSHNVQGEMYKFIAPVCVMFLQ